MKPKPYLEDKKPLDYKKMLKVDLPEKENFSSSIESILDNSKKSFFAYLRNKLGPIHEEKSEHKCQQFERVISEKKPSGLPAQHGLDDVSKMQKQSNELSNQEVDKSEAKFNANASINRKKWDTSAENFQQVTSKIEKQKPDLPVQQARSNSTAVTQQNTNLKTKNYSKEHHSNHFPPIQTRKTVLNSVQCVKGNLHSTHPNNCAETEGKINFNTLYNPNKVSEKTFQNDMANTENNYFYNNNQEWLVAKQTVQKPKDHDLLNAEPCCMKNMYLSEADIQKQEFLERKFAQEEYRKKLEHQILQRKPSKCIRPKSTLKFDGKAEFETENKQNYINFKIVSKIPDQKTFYLNEHENNQQINNFSENCIKQQNLIKLNNEGSVQATKKNMQKSNHLTSCKYRSTRPQSSLTSSGKFKEHLQYQNEPLSQQKRHFNQIDHQKFNDNMVNQYDLDAHESILNQKNFYDKLEGKDENNNCYLDENYKETVCDKYVLNQRHAKASKMQNKTSNEPIFCENCKHHLMNNSNIELEESSKKNASEMNFSPEFKKSKPLYKKNKLIEARNLPLIRSKSQKSYTQESDKIKSHNSIPRFIQAGQKKPYKNMSHLKFEGQNSFVTTNSLAYRDNSMQNLIKKNDNTLNRGVFADQIQSLNNKHGISGNIRGRVKNKYRDLFASSEDIFNSQQTNLNLNLNKPPIKHKSMYNLNELTSESEKESEQEDEEICESEELNNNDNKEQIQNEIEQKENIANTSNEKRLIFVPKNKPPSKFDHPSDNFERKKELTLNGCYGAQLQCPALELMPDKYIYKYSTGVHKYFNKVNCID